MEFDLSLNASSSKPPSAGPRYAADAGIAYSLSNDEILFQSKRSGENHVMTNDVLRALGQAREFRTLNAHVQAIVATQPALANQQSAVKKVLEALVSRGLLIAEDALIASWRQPDGQALVPFAGIAIRTCDRPERLQALLASISASSMEQAQYPLFIVDDSRSEQARARNEQLASDAGATYLGVKYQQRYLDFLARQAGEEAATLAKLAAPGMQEGFSGGRVLNFIALFFAGHRFALLDDDFLYSWLQQPDVQEGELVFSAASQVEVRLADNFEALACTGQVPAADALPLHADLVGQRIGDVLAQSQWQRVSVVGLTVADCQSMNADAPVLMTCQGVWGHSGSEQPHWLYVLTGQARQAFTSDRERYMRHRAAPVMMNAAKHWCFHREPRFLPLAVDASRWLPPTMPEGRGEDLLFNTLLLALHPGGQALEAPFALQHGREQQHQYTDAQRQSAMTPGLATLLADYVQARIEQCEAASAEHRFNWILGQLEDLANASSQRRENFLREYLGWVRGDFIGQLQRQTSDWPDVPVYWQADAQAMIKANAKALLQSDDLRLADTGRSDDKQATVDDCFERIRAWLECARAWPIIWQAACAQDTLEKRLKVA
jgi:hypothetical protein